MEIIGYSERGAMNALFYGMASNAKGDDDSQMREFLRLAGIDDPKSFSDFEIYPEFSLSEFGSPDLVIIAQKEESKVVFFIEAKASCGLTYKTDEQKNKHEEYISHEKWKNGHASNLFFQLRLKHFFFEQRYNILDTGAKATTGQEKVEKTKNHIRKIGNNPIVIKFAKEIRECSKAYYIAIIPQCNEIELPKGYPKTLNVNFVSWEDIYNSSLGILLKGTFDFNQNENVSQILNNPIKQ